MGSLRRHLRRQGLTLVEVALLICVCGVLLAVFVPTFVRHLRTSKVSEASEQLERMHEATSAYFAAVHDVDGHRRTACLPAAAGPAPESPSADPVDFDFQADDTPGAETWSALGFAVEQPIRYRYEFLPAQPGCGLEALDGTPLVTLRAEGDLDDDGKRSLFERQADVNEDGELVPVGILYMLDRTE